MLFIAAPLQCVPALSPGKPAAVQQLPTEQNLPLTETNFAVLGVSELSLQGPLWEVKRGRGGGRGVVLK